MRTGRATFVTIGRARAVAGAAVGAVVSPHIGLNHGFRGLLEGGFFRLPAGKERDLGSSSSRRRSGWVEWRWWWWWVE
jgi:hypothetical protein